jgi:hypothetical protein
LTPLEWLLVIGLWQLKQRIRVTGSPHKKRHRLSLGR